MRQTKSSWKLSLNFISGDSLTASRSLPCLQAHNAGDRNGRPRSSTWVCLRERKTAQLIEVTER